jgi:hypothetical protein
MARRIAVDEWRGSTTTAVYRPRDRRHCTSTWTVLTAALIMITVDEHGVVTLLSCGFQR